MTENEDRENLKNFMFVIRHILETIVERRDNFFKGETRELLLNAWNDQASKFDLVNRKIEEIPNEMLENEGLTGPNLYFKLSIVKGYLENRPELFYYDFQISHIFGLVQTDGVFSYEMSKDQYHSFWSYVDNHLIPRLSEEERKGFWRKSKRILRGLLNRIEPLLKSILLVAGIGFAIDEFKDTIRADFS